MDVFTSITLNYFPKALVLARSVKKFHPDWTFHLIINDRLADSDKNEFQDGLNKMLFDKVVWIDDMEIPNLYNWIFKHTVVELCTAVKGPYLQQLVKQGIEKILYIDPDIAVFNDLNQVETMLDEHSILLTPHLLDYSDDPQAIYDNEIAGTMRHGVFNLGFLAINSKKADGKRFSDWWGDRLQNYCYADYDEGLFTDQKWADLVPAFFEDYFVIRDPGYDVASWNINKRQISMSDIGQLMVNEIYPLRFYHFTGYDSGAGQFMTHRYSSDNRLLDEIWAWYLQEIKTMAQDEWGTQPCYFNYYLDGNEISKDDRKTYRETLDLQIAYPNPFEIRNFQKIISGAKGNKTSGQHSKYS